eukprot:993293-Prorocentrum_minimum.AAC.2
MSSISMQPAERSPLAQLAGCKRTFEHANGANNNGSYNYNGLRGNSSNGPVQGLMRHIQPNYLAAGRGEGGLHSTGEGDWHQVRAMLRGIHPDRRKGSICA